MISDKDKSIIDAYGAREVLGVAAKRKTFLIDPDGRIAFVWPKVRVEGHADDVVATIGRLASKS
jgi:peroxiredoxin Q/BCP